MINQHPITPPPELVMQWWDRTLLGNFHEFESIATQAARWGADQELDACLKWIGSFCATWTCGRRPEDVLRAARRPKPPSLKEQALKALEQLLRDPEAGELTSAPDTIRRALEALPND